MTLIELGILDSLWLFIGILTLIGLWIQASIAAASAKAKAAALQKKIVELMAAQEDLGQQNQFSREVAEAFFAQSTGPKLPFDDHQNPWKGTRVIPPRSGYRDDDEVIMNPKNARRT